MGLPPMDRNDSFGALILRGHFSHILSETGKIGSRLVWRDSIILQSICSKDIRVRGLLRSPASQLPMRGCPYLAPFGSVDGKVFDLHFNANVKDFSSRCTKA